MKGTITQYVVLGIMLLVIVLIVSFLPAARENHMTGKQASPGAATHLSVSNKAGKVRAD